jgi:asparagine synthase (glutamine-hydrolysing)
MCGVCGIVGPAGPWAEDRVRKMLRALVHRGPDEEGMLARSGAVFGVRRLSIIDLAAGHQPVYNEAGDVATVFNGEIYNCRELRTTLQARGHRFRTQSDTEVIVHSYEEWGSGCVDHLHGMFAFALWDGRKAEHGASNRGSVFLARDRLGIKPLYYTIIGGTLFFASEIRALLASEALNRKLNVSAIDAYLLFGSIAEPSMLLEGVYSLPAGHCLTLALDSALSPKPEMYWDPCLRANRIIDPPGSLRSAAGEVRKILENAVNTQLVADVPIGLFLSGGLDSAALAALAVRQRPALQSFTLSFPESGFDEGPASRAIAQQFGTKHHEIQLTASEMQSKLFEAIGALDQPSMDGVNTFFISWGARRAGLKVAISGLGADELFGGYPTFGRTRYMSALLAMVRRMPAGVRELISEALLAISRRSGVHSPEKIRKIAALFSHPEALPHAYFYTRTLFTPQQAERLLASVHQVLGWGSSDSDRFAWQRALVLLVRRANTFRGQSVISYLELRTYMLNTLLRDTDSMSMHHSLEVRVPFLDDVLVEFVEALPDSAKTGPGQKPLLAQAVRDIVPEHILTHPKRTFTLPWEDWLRGELGKQVASGLGSLSPSLASVLDSKAIQSVWREFLARRIGWARPWSLFVLNEWVRKHIDHTESRIQETVLPAARIAANG